MDASKNLKSWIKDGTEVGCSEDGEWVCYQIYECVGETAEEALENLSILATDQDGGEVWCRGFDQCPNSRVEKEILTLLGLEAENHEQHKKPSAMD